MTLATSTDDRFVPLPPITLLLARQGKCYRMRMSDHNDQIADQAAEAAQRASLMARAALIIACIAIALALLGLFLPI